MADPEACLLQRWPGLGDRPGEAHRHPSEQGGQGQFHEGRLADCNHRRTRALADGSQHVQPRVAAQQGGCHCR